MSKSTPALLALMLFSAVSRLTASDNRQDQTLRGIETVNVIVEDLDQDASKIGLEKNAVQTDTELRLRQNGIRVTDVNDRKNVQGCVYVRVTILDRAASIHVEILQDSVLLRDLSILAVQSTTWETSMLIINASGERSIRASVLDEIDKFINAWLSVNPRPR